MAGKRAAAWGRRRGDTGGKYEVRERPGTDRG